MSRSYREAMEHIEVTPDMRERILKNLAEAEPKPTPRTVRFIPWKQILSVAACAAILLVGVTVLPHGDEFGSESPAPSEIVTAPAPTQEFSSLEELSAAAGFAVKQPQSFPFTVQETTYTLLFGELAQVEQTSVSGETLLYRVSQEEGDNSGDYTVYSVEQPLNVDETEVLLKGSESGFCLAVWQKDGFSYSLHSSVELTVEQMQAIIQSLS